MIIVLLHWTGSLCSQVLQNDIVIVNVGFEQRYDILKAVVLVAEQSPLAIGVNVQMRKAQDVDTILLNNKVETPIIFLNNLSNGLALVGATFDSLYATGYGNFYSDGDKIVYAIANFPNNGVFYDSFSSSIVGAVDKKKLDDFTGKIKIQLSESDVNASVIPMKKLFDSNKLFLNSLNGKIVVFGYLGNSSNTASQCFPTKSDEDLFNVELVDADKQCFVYSTVIQAYLIRKGLE
ncbi:MAG: hypothetical protein ACPGD5_03135 [Salibacteraceae bacterium]